MFIIKKSLINFYHLIPNSSPEFACFINKLKKKGEQQKFIRKKGKVVGLIKLKNV